MPDDAYSLFNELKTMNDVQRFIDLGQEENLYLDYKQASYSNGKLRSDDADNLATALSGFANTEGGILIWGVKTGDLSENEDLPEKVIPIQNLLGFRQALETSLMTRVTPSVEGVVFN